MNSVFSTILALLVTGFQFCICSYEVRVLVFDARHLVLVLLLVFRKQVLNPNRSKTDSFSVLCLLTLTKYALVNEKFSSIRKTGFSALLLVVNQPPMVSQSDHPSWLQYLQFGIHCLIICVIQLLTPNSSGRTEDISVCQTFEVLAH